jgi:hypothetical protein
MALTKAHNRMIAGSVVNVLDFGATGNGTTDDTAAIQAAIDSLSSTGGKVHVPVGVYLISSPIELSTGSGSRSIILYGDGTGQVNNVTNSATVISNSANDNCLVIRGLGGDGVRDLSIIDSFSGTRTAGDGIYVNRDGSPNGNSTFELSNINVADHYNGFYMARPVLSLLSNCIARGSLNHGYFFDTDVSGSGTSVQFSSCWAQGSGVDGYNIDGSQYILFNNCAVDGSGRYGYYVDNSGGVNPNGVTFVGCGAESNTNDNLHIENMSALSIVGGSLATSSADGIHLVNVNGGFIAGVKLTGNTGYGINIDSSCTNITSVSPNFIANTAGEINDTGNKHVGINSADAGVISTSGTAANPSYTFGADPDTGLYLLSDGTIGITVAGTRKYRINATALSPSDSKATDIGSSSYPFKDGYIYEFMQGSEMTEPGAGPANTGRLFYKDNGSGKTQLCVRFATGATQILATEP